MPGYSGRRLSVNMSQYLQNLNEEVSPSGLSPEETSIDHDLSLFENANFIDWDGGAQTRLDFQPPAEADANPSMGMAVDGTPGSLGMDFSLTGDDFGFDFNQYSSSAVPFTEGLGHPQTLPPNIAHNYPPSGAQQPAYGAQSPAQGKKATSASKRTASRQISLEEQSRIAAEEDKRRRNTAASARFRVKKKIREQALEKREKELSDEVSALNKRIMQLETENKFLKNLVVEKTGTKESKFDAKLAEALEALSRSSESGEEKTKSAEHERAAPVA